MKAQIILLVSIDSEDKSPAGSNSGFRWIGPNKDTGMGQITLARGAFIGGTDPVSVMAHEMGHVIAGIFDLPAQKAVKERQEKLDMAKEREAWDVAGKMGVPINPQTKDFSLWTYQGHPVDPTAGPTNTPEFVEEEQRNGK